MVTRRSVLQTIATVIVTPWTVALSGCNTWRWDTPLRSSDPLSFIFSLKSALFGHSTMGPYEQYFVHRLREDPELSGEITLLHTLLDQEASKHQGREFNRLDALLQREIVNELSARGYNQSDPKDPAVKVYQKILRPIFSLYASSDAWIRAGYDTFPGNSSGLELYTKPPRSTQTENV